MGRLSLSYVDIQGVVNSEAIFDYVGRQVTYGTRGNASGNYGEGEKHITGAEFKLRQRVSGKG